MQRSPLTGLRQRAMPRCRPGLGCASSGREGKRPRMFPSASRLAFAGTVLMTVADKLPTLNVEAACRTAATMDDSMSLRSSLRQCLADGCSARDQWETQRTQSPLAVRQRCVTTTETGGDPSYVEVLVCLQMARDAAQMEDPLGSGRQDKK